MSNSVTTAIRQSVRDMAIGRTRTTEKADRATVEQVSVHLQFVELGFQFLPGHSHILYKCMSCVLQLMKCTQMHLI